MSRPGASDSRRWVLSGTIALVGAGLVVSLFRVPEAVALPAGRPKKLPPVSMQPDDGIDAAFDERKILTDPTPLFLPTKWNAPRKPVERPEPGAAFENYQPSYVAGTLEEGLRLNFPSPVDLSADKVEILINTPGPLLAGIGRAGATPPPLGDRTGFVEVIAEGTGRPVFSQALQDARPPGEGAWRPVVFMGRVDAMGLVGTLNVTQQSGVEGVDEYFRRYLVQTLRVGQRLEPGVYRISVGP